MVITHLYVLEVFDVDRQIFGLITFKPVSFTVCFFKRHGLDKYVYRQLISKSSDSAIMPRSITVLLQFYFCSDE